MSLSSEVHLSLSSSQIATLTHLSSLLHLFHHRNKNQHSHSLWYRPFSLFRQQLTHLLRDLTHLNHTPKSHLQKSQKKSQDAALIARTSRRLEFWRDVMVGKWLRAFSQLVADARFAVLGLVPMACLAEVCAVVGVTGQLEEMGEREVRRVLEEFGKEEWGGLKEGEVSGGGKEDVGEVVVRGADDLRQGVREEVEALRSAPAVDVTKKASKKRSVDSTTKPKKKRKKGGDAIDDIFG